MTKAYQRAELGVIDFGMFAGWKWSEVPEKYLRYLVSSACMTNRDHKRAARAELLQRKIAEGQLPLFDLS